MLMSLVLVRDVRVLQLAVRVRVRRQCPAQWASCANASLKNGSLSGSSGRLRSWRANRNTQTPASPTGMATSIQWIGNRSCVEHRRDQPDQVDEPHQRG